MTIKVLVVDDSALIRQILSEIIKSEPDMTLVGAAPDAFVAKKLVLEKAPDVITLDIEMPKVDGLRFLEVLMNARPTPVVMISTLTEKGAEATLRSLELGAIDFVAKPKIGVAQGMAEYHELIVDKIRTAARSKVKKASPAKVSSVNKVSYSGTEKLIAIGASTGGTEAIKEVLRTFPANAPATVITQHMPAGFTSTYARRLDAVCQMQVKEAKGGERLLPGQAYLAPGDKHMEIERSGADYRIRLTDGARVSGHKPSVDVLFNSLCKSAGNNAIGVLLTGMGSDGAIGLHELFNAGCETFCQDEASCIVFGMPKVAIEKGAARHITSLDDMGKAVMQTVEKLSAGSRL
ncbi:MULTISPECIES: protein-glutamate methylesterase/protein-glutamine glutaminase [Alteromonas]|uniref:Protein-glutamate methylesterase/protein-glutamine glutaminase n=1 Tax=Alteromonas macleodii TaxID=28108 RepID=A0A6T9XWW4_ALTMA|nr:MULTISPECIES: chemotaxis response regulator protein-glutamate methylesterase [Alteromonas]MCZ8531404.1 chemotaxis response regulator protein-glutamate methylesterase [Alteromonas sp. PRIM-21]CAB9492350.1 fused chemotaxis regulator; protein-glutamate methylesterase in two-component regulatory system with CheA [Alteromonas macleodii]